MVAVVIGIIGSESTKNYGLFQDLQHDPDINVLYTESPSSLLKRAVNRVLRNRTGARETVMSWEQDLLDHIGEYELLVVVDTALRKLDQRFLLRCKTSNHALRVNCLLLNSMSSITLTDSRIRSAVDAFPWDEILTFDPEDAERNKWRYTGLHYYSRKPLPVPPVPSHDLFYAGSIKGNRGRTILRLLEFLDSQKVKCDFICTRVKQVHPLPLPKGLHLIRKRIPYSDTLIRMHDSNCILEILQDGQGGTSLRYFEAVCYNKKLLTTNSRIIDYPFYDDRYMKVFSTFSEIDTAWLKTVEDIDYGYQGEFSPKHLIAGLKNYE